VAFKRKPTLMSIRNHENQVELEPMQRDIAPRRASMQLDVLNRVKA
jgi:hypothetical protein